MFTYLKNRAVVASAVIVAGLVPALALAGGGGVDYSELADAVDFGTIATGVMAVAAALVGVYVVIRGVKFMIGFVRGG